MKRFFFVLIILSIPEMSWAQKWRLQANGGISTPTELTHKQVVIGHVPIDGLLDLGKVVLTGGVAAFRSDSAFEYGISLQMLSVVFYRAIEINNTSAVYHTYLGNPLFPVTAVFNYTHHKNRDNAFIGFNAGAVFSRGKTTENFSDLNAESDLTIYYNSGSGFTVGTQLGYRHNFRRFNYGFQLQANYMRLKLTHGTNSEQFTFNVMYFPIQLYAGLYL